MVDKKEGKEKDAGESKHIGEGLGISGFTLGILSIVFAGLYGVILSIVGLIFCMIQQKKHKTKLGKIGLIINIIGLIVSIVYLVVYFQYLMPLIQQQLGQIA